MPIKPWIAALVLCLLILSPTMGCLGEKAPATVSAAPPTVVLNYHRTGGIAGVDERLVVFDNGMAVLSTQTSSHNIQLSGVELARVIGLFKSAEFSSLVGNYTSHHSGTDLMKYRITYYNKTVVVDDSTAPTALQPVITELNTILNTGRAVDTLPGLPPVLTT